MKMRGGALPWVLLILTVAALLFMYVLVDPPNEQPMDEQAAAGQVATPVSLRA